MALGESGRGMRMTTISGGSPRSDRANEAKQKKETVTQIITAATAEGAVFGPKPVVAGQLLRLPSTTRRGPKEFRMFTLVKDTDQNALNEFLQKSEPEDAPEVQILGHKEYFSDHKAAVIVTVWFRRIEYLQLAQPQVEKLSKHLAAVEHEVD